MTYYTFKNNITSIDGILFKDERIIIPSKLRREILECAHTSHAGIGLSKEGCDILCSGQV